MGDILVGHIKGNISFYYLPGDENLNEFPQAHKTIRQKAKAADQCKGNYNDVRAFDPFSC
ncbi:hypothetical protein D3C86_1826210 [compost metagenome]